MRASKTVRRLGRRRRKRYSDKGKRGEDYTLMLESGVSDAAKRNRRARCRESCRGLVYRSYVCRSDFTAGKYTGTETPVGLGMLPAPSDFHSYGKRGVLGAGPLLGAGLFWAWSFLDAGFLLGVGLFGRGAFFWCELSSGAAEGSGIWASLAAPIAGRGRVGSARREMFSRTSPSAP